MHFCLTANYTPKALNAMRENPNTNRREAVEKLVTAAGGKLVAMYGTIAEGPGALVIFDADAVAAAAMAGVAASSDGLHNVKMLRLFSGRKWLPSGKSECRSTGPLNSPVNRFLGPAFSSRIGRKRTRRRCVLDACRQVRGGITSAAQRALLRRATPAI